MENNLTVKNAPQKETGFVGFFDILGYKSFLESGITEVAFKVVDILNEIPRRINEVIKNDHLGGIHLGSILDSDIEWSLNQIIPLVVSDSILLRSSYDGNRDPSKRPSQAVTFLVAAHVLQRDMFEHGLPLRGAIAFGDCIFAGHVFAGKPIIDAYTLGHRLDLAACALHETAENEFKTLVTMATEWKGFLDEGRQLVRYRTPVKGGDTELDRLLLNLAWPRLKVYPPLKERPDLRQYVHEQCWKHNKQIGLDDISKVENTERFLRFLRSRFPQLV